MYNIKPIFNPISNPQIWEQFAHIEMLSCEVTHNIKADKEYVIGLYKDAYEKNKHNYAFAAYKDQDDDINLSQHGEMIGFISGFVDNLGCYVSSLFVLPEFQKQHVGSSLLHVVESKMCLYKTKIHLVSLNGSKNFYEHNGFCSYDTSSHFIKTVSKPKVGDFPVFGWMSKFSKMATFEVNTEFKNLQKYQPAFVYVNIDGNIEAVIDYNNNVQINPKKSQTMQEFIINSLKRSLENSK